MTNNIPSNICNISDIERDRRQSAPARPHTSDVYAQVKILRRSVQEVNAMLEPKKSELILQKTKELENAEVAASNPTNFTRRSSNTASVKRSSNFKSILNKFNVMQTSTSNNGGENLKQQCCKKQSMPNMKT